MIAVEEGVVADEAAANAFATWDPGRPLLTHRQFALQTKLPGGPLKGSPCDPSTDPVQNFIVDQLDSGKWERVFWASCPQIAGKTQIAILVPALRAVVELRAVVGYGLPTLQDLDRGWTTKLAPTIKDAGFQGYLPLTGPGSKGGRPPVVTFEDPVTRTSLGSFVFLAGGAKQVTCRLVVIDEIDSWREASGKPRWSDLEDTWARADSFQELAIRIGTGTVETDNPSESIILECVENLGTGTRLWAKCRHCGAYAPMEFSSFTWEYSVVVANGKPSPDLERAKSTARYACAKCATLWTEDDRQAALRAAVFAHKGQTVDDAGAIVGPAPQTKAFGIRTHALDCVLTTMGAIAEKACAAQYALQQHANHEPMRKFYRYQRVEHYKEPEPDGEITAGGLARFSDRSTIDKRTVPEWARFLVLTQDVQGDRHYWLLVAYGDGERWGIVDWGYEYLAPVDSNRAPTPEDRQRTLNTIRDLGTTGWQVAGGEDRMYPVSCGVDGGYLPDEIAAWVQGEPAWKFMRGVGRDEIKHSQEGVDRELPREVSATKALQARRPKGWRIFWWKVDGHYFRRAAHAALLRNPDQPTSGMVPRGLKANADLLLHLSGEVWDEGAEGKKGYWREVRKRHDYLDCLVYNLALALLHRHMPNSRNPSAPPRKYGVVGTAFGA